MTKQIPLSRGKFALVDDADFDWLNQWKWHITAAGYAQRHATMPDGTSPYVYMHRLIAGAGKGTYADHINHNTLDNRRENLRVATPAQSICNTRSRKGATSIFKGVCLSQKRWVATIQIGGRSNHLGRFLTQREAAKAYNDAAIKYHGEFANLNDLSILPADQDVPFPPNRPTASKYRGIFKARKRWSAMIAVNHVRTFLGNFDTEIKAALAYDAYVKENGLARELNFP